MDIKYQDPKNTITSDRGHDELPTQTMHCKEGNPWKNYHSFAWSLIPSKWVPFNDPCLKIRIFLVWLAKNQSYTAPVSHRTRPLSRTYLLHKAPCDHKHRGPLAKDSKDPTNERPVVFEILKCQMSTSENVLFCCSKKDLSWRWNYLQPCCFNCLIGSMIFAFSKKIWQTNQKSLKSKGFGCTWLVNHPSTWPWPSWCRNSPK